MQSLLTAALISSVMTGAAQGDDEVKVRLYIEGAY